MRLGVAWYLHPDELHKGDGKHVRYLTDSSKKYAELRACDDALAKVLRELVESNKRNVVAVCESGILPCDKAYYEPCLSYTQDASRASKQATRQDWLESALKATEEAKVVFVDPDNGISPETVKPLHKNGPKYVFMDDLHRFYKRGQSLIIYHHLGRTNAVDQIKCLSRRLRQELDLPSRQPWALRYRRGTARVYFIIAQKQHEPILWDQLKGFLDNKCWFQRQLGFPHPHFELVE